MEGEDWINWSDAYRPTADTVFVTKSDWGCYLWIEGILESIGFPYNPNDKR